MDVRKLERGETIAAASALLLLLVMFAFSWFSSDGVANGGRNAWRSFGFIDFVLLITVGAALGLALITTAARSVNKPVAGSAVAALLGALSTVLVLFRIVFPPDFGDYGFGTLAEIGTSAQLGAWLGLILAAGVAYGGWVGMQEDGARRSAHARRRRPPGGTPSRPPSGQPGG